MTGLIPKNCINWFGKYQFFVSYFGKENILDCNLNFEKTKAGQWFFFGLLGVLLSEFVGYVATFVSGVQHLY